MFMKLLTVIAAPSQAYQEYKRSEAKLSPVQGLGHVRHQDVMSRIYVQVSPGGNKCAERNKN